MKLLKYITSFILVFIFGIYSVNAASGKISVSANTKSVKVGNTVKVTTTVSSSDLGAWEYCISYDSSKLKLQSSTANSGNCVRAAVVGQTGTKETWTFKALKSGSSTVTVKSYAIYSYEDESQLSVSKGSVNITAKTQEQIEASYSKNNNLKSLSVEGYEFTEKFSNDKLEYSVDVPNSVTKINILASKEDSKASVSGTGEKDVVEGSNVFNVVVTAENGSKREFKINVNVEDKNPINVKLNNTDYTVVKRSDLIKIPTGFQLNKTDINDISVPSIYNENLDITLVTLKDADGNIILSKYDNGKYEEYIEIGFNKVVVNILKISRDKLPDGYEEYKHKINDKEISVYKKDESSKFALIYGQDTSSGDKNIYQIDLEDLTIQRLNEEFTKEEKADNTFLYLAISLGIIVILETIIVISINSKNKKIMKMISSKRVKKSSESIDVKTDDKEEEAKDTAKKKKKKSKTILDE